MLVSVIIPLFNSSIFIKQTLNSVLKQTFKNIEIILIDDFSTDNTLKIVKQYTNTNIELHNNKYSKGIVGAMNTAFEITKGDFVALLDHDDIAVSTRIEEQIKFLTNNKSIGVCGTWMQEFEKRNKIWKYYTNHNEIQACILFHSPIANPTAMFRTELIHKYHLKYDDNYEYAQDNQFWAKMSLITKFSNIPKILTFYRKHLKNASKIYKVSQFESWKKTLSWYIKPWLNEILNKYPDFFKILYSVKYTEFREIYLESQKFYIEFFKNIISINNRIPIFDSCGLKTVIEDKIFSIK
jgi:glycosyltransferase involved in cell wall biosynthesis